MNDQAQDAAVLWRTHVLRPLLALHSLFPVDPQPMAQHVLPMGSLKSFLGRQMGWTRMDQETGSLSFSRAMSWDIELLKSSWITMWMIESWVLFSGSCWTPTFTEY